MNRAEYIKKTREGKKTFSVLIEKEKMEKLEKRLEEEKKTKKRWLEEKIDEK